MKRIERQSIVHIIQYLRTAAFTNGDVIELIYDRYGVQMYLENADDIMIRIDELVEWAYIIPMCEALLANVPGLREIRRNELEIHSKLQQLNHKNAIWHQKPAYITTAIATLRKKPMYIEVVVAILALAIMGNIGIYCR